MEFPPGIRFHPTDVELLLHYLKRKLLGKLLEPKLVAEVDIYQFHPADLKEKACLNKDLNWYFFCPRGRKYCIGNRTNRATRSGYWKATGNDRAVIDRGRTVGKVKTLVFHMGKPPKGERTDWVMHEYKLEDAELANSGAPQAYVLCKIFKKSGLGPKNAEQYGAPYIEEEWDLDQNASGVTNTISPPEQIYSSDVALSGVDEAPTPISKSAAANHDDHVVELASDSTPKADLLNSVLKDHHDHVVEIASDTTPKADLLNPVQNNLDELWCVDDFKGIYDGLEDIPLDVNGLWPLPDCRGNSDSLFDDIMKELNP